MAKEIYRDFKIEDGVEWTTIYYDDGSVYGEGEIGEPFKTYFRLSEIILRGKDIQERLSACEATYDILPAFVREYLKDSPKLPDTIACRDIGVELYLRLGEWDKARSAINKIAAAGAYGDNGLAAFKYFQNYKQTAELALNFLRQNPGFPQNKIYKALIGADKDCLKSFTRSSMMIRKVKAGSTNKLYCK